MGVEAMRFEDFFDEEEIETYRRVKSGSMILARIARGVAADLVDGEIQKTGKEFVHTSRGCYRLAMAFNSDNSTEAVAHEEMGAELVVMSDPQQMRQFFAQHQLDVGRAFREFNRRVKALMSKELA